MNRSHWGVFVDRSGVSATPPQPLRMRQSSADLLDVVAQAPYEIADLEVCWPFDGVFLSIIFYLYIYTCINKEHDDDDVERMTHRVDGSASI